MKNEPKIIYIQVGEDCPKDESFNNLAFGSVSWADERIFENDLIYVNYSLIKSLLDKIECSSDIVKKIEKLLKT